MTSWCLNYNTMSTNRNHPNERPSDNELLPVEEQTLNKIESSALTCGTKKSLLMQHDMPRGRRRVSYDSDLPTLLHPPNIKQRQYPRRNSKVASMLVLSTMGAVQSLEHSWNEPPLTNAEDEEQGMLLESTTTETQVDEGNSKEPPPKKRKT